MLTEQAKRALGFHLEMLREHAKDKKLPKRKLEQQAVKARVLAVAAVDWQLSTEEAWEEAHQGLLMPGQPAPDYPGALNYLPYFLVHLQNAVQLHKNLAPPALLGVDISRWGTPNMLRGRMKFALGCVEGRYYKVFQKVLQAAAKNEEYQLRGKPETVAN